MDTLPSPSPTLRSWILSLHQVRHCGVGYSPFTKSDIAELDTLPSPSPTLRSWILSLHQVRHCGVGYSPFTKSDIKIPKVCLSLLTTDPPLLPIHVGNTALAQAGCSFQESAASHRSLRLQYKHPAKCFQFHHCKHFTSTCSCSVLDA